MNQPSLSSPTQQDGVAGPSVVWLAMGFLLAGLGTVMLGPLMPTLLHDWRLSDQQGGLLLAAKFVGSFLGGVSVPRRLRFGVLGGMAAALAWGRSLLLQISCSADATGSIPARRLRPLTSSGAWAQCYAE